MRDTCAIRAEGSLGNRLRIVYSTSTNTEAHGRTQVFDLVDYLKAHKQTVDPLILAGLFHKQFVIIHPFMDGNGRSARLATKVLLAGMGLNTFNLFSFENYYNQNVTKYFERVGVIGNYYELKATVDFTGWLEYFTRDDAAAVPPGH